MPKRSDPIARVLEAYRALTDAERLAADYLMRSESIGTPARRGRPVGSRNRAAAKEGL